MKFMTSRETQEYKGGGGGWHHIGLLRAKCHKVSQSSIAHSNSYDFRFGLSYY